MTLGAVNSAVSFCSQGSKTQHYHPHAGGWRQLPARSFHSSPLTTAVAAPAHMPSYCCASLCHVCLASVAVCSGGVCVTQRQPPAWACATCSTAYQSLAPHCTHHPLCKFACATGRCRQHQAWQSAAGYRASCGMGARAAAHRTPQPVLRPAASQCCLLSHWFVHCSLVCSCSHFHHQTNSAHWEQRGCDGEATRQGRARGGLNVARRKIVSICQGCKSLEQAALEFACDITAGGRQACASE